jgi:hypothetical protein
MLVSYKDTYGAEQQTTTRLIHTKNLQVFREWIQVNDKYTYGAGWKNVQSFSDSLFYTTAKRFILK